MTVGEGKAVRNSNDASCPSSSEVHLYIDKTKQHFGNINEYSAMTNRHGGLSAKGKYHSTNKRDSYRGIYNAWLS